MSATDKAIECENISKRFGYFFALKKNTFDVHKNEMLGIVGANGAGKSTLFRILSCVMEPTEGKFSVFGKKHTSNIISIKKDIGIITDESVLYGELTIKENLRFYANLHYNFSNEDIERKIEKYTKLLNLNEWINEPVRILSKGMKRKVEIIRALIHNPKILLLDEPFSGIDFKSINIILSLLKQLREDEKTTIVLATHKIEMVKQICDRLMILQKGRIKKIVKRENFKSLNLEDYF